MFGPALAMARIPAPTKRRSGCISSALHNGNHFAFHQPLGMLRADDGQSVDVQFLSVY